MAKLHISEFVALAPDGAAFPAVMQLPQLPPVAQQTVTFTTSTQSSALNASTRFVRVISDADCHIEVGANPTATTSSLKLMSGSAEYFGVTPGHKIAVIAAA